MTYRGWVLGTVLDGGVPLGKKKGKSFLGARQKVSPTLTMMAHADSICVLLFLLSAGKTAQTV